MSAWSDLGPTAPSRMEVFAQAFELMRLATLARDLTSAGPGQDVPRAIRTLEQARALLSPGSSFPPAAREDGAAIAVRGLAKDLGQLRQIFEEWAARDVNDQPVNPRTGVRPFGTGDLRRLIEVLTAARSLATTRPAPEQAPDYSA